jgi:hypothetical protein
MKEAKHPPLDAVMGGDGTYRSDPGIGPGDTSDSASDLPEEQQGVDTDRQSTGERPSVENRPNIASGEDVDIDREVSEEEAGVSRAPSDPVRNGGTPD